MPTAGWYDDPHGGGGKRWWDGQRWTEHIVPPPPPGAPGAAAAAGGTWPATVPTTASSPTTSGGSSGGGKTALIIVLVVAVLLLVVIGGVLAVFGVRSGLAGMFDVMRSEADIHVEQSTEAPVTGEPPSGEPDDRVDGQVSAGHQRAFEVPTGERWVLEFEAPDGLLVIDVRGQEDLDPVAELYDVDTGRVLARNDDRDMDQQDRYGGDTFDSLVEVEVEAGSYRLVVDGFAGQGGPGVVAFPVVGE